MSKKEKYLLAPAVAIQVLSVFNPEYASMLNITVILLWIHIAVDKTDR